MFGYIYNFKMELGVCGVKGSCVLILQDSDEENPESCSAGRHRVRHGGIREGIVLVKVHIGSKGLH